MLWIGDPAHHREVFWAPLARPLIFVVASLHCWGCGARLEQLIPWAYKIC